MNVSLFPGYDFHVQLTVLHMRLGVFAASKADIVQLHSVFPCRSPQLLVADTTAIKARLMSNWWSVCAQFVCVGYLPQPYWLS